MSDSRPSNVLPTLQVRVVHFICDLGCLHVVSVCWGVFTCPVIDNLPSTFLGGVIIHNMFVCFSEDNFNEDEGCDYVGGQEGGQPGEKDEENGKVSKGVGNAGDAGYPRPMVAENFLGREDTYVAYKEFARAMGFGVRKGDAGRVDGVWVRRDFFYHRQGVRYPKHYDRPERVRKEQLESRTNYKAKLKIYYDVHRSLWKVRTIVDDHNHDLAAAMFSYLLPSHRKMRNSDKAQVDSMKQFGIPTFKIMAYMAGQSGRYGMLRFTKRYLYNYVHGQRAARISDGDAAATISYLEGNADADLRTVAHYMRNAENCLGSLFWADGKMVSDYHLFGDVVAFDSTYKSNKYKKPLVVFSGTNHHKQTTIFGFALLEDEEVHSYR
ncbi:protein FAR1-RELATED SEQUENCE 5-like [Arachis duranensis]|uniref:Protein FAR1-RELATED SEQUENCE 5-like n=1 Tax=Arachis duranensis TaxID=130453 RepID=A0A9C6WQ84_ARADU|nr:protein FAR1-RELATED SEQUENCE 5-like [Arachis duranensis]